MLWVYKVSAYTLNGPDAAELSLEILLVGIIAESRDHECLEGIATNVWIVGRVDCVPGVSVKFCAHWIGQGI